MIESLVKSKMFEPVTATNGSALCSVDPPSYVRSAKIAPICALMCNDDDNCNSYNYRENTRQCQLYDYIPNRYSVVAGCTSQQGKSISAWNKQQTHIDNNF